jgi:DNA-binding beta-propeller fold protein YncE
VAVAPDGGQAYVSDNVAGDVYAVALPSLSERWRAHVGGRPGPLLADADRVLVSLFDAGAVLELEAASGTELARHAAGSGPGQLAMAGGEVWVASSAGGVRSLSGGSRSAPAGFGLATTVGGELWAADQRGGGVVRVADGRRAPLPEGLHPFWLAAGEGPTLLVAAEGEDEDEDRGGVFMLDTRDLALTRLDSPRDPDLVTSAGGRVFVAAHGERQVRVLEPGRPPIAWASGVEAVALAADEPLGLLVVVADARE